MKRNFHTSPTCPSKLKACNKWECLLTQKFFHKQRSWPQKIRLHHFSPDHSNSIFCHGWWLENSWYVGFFVSELSVTDTDRKLIWKSSVNFRSAKVAVYMKAACLVLSFYNFKKFWDFTCFICLCFISCCFWSSWRLGVYILESWPAQREESTRTQLFAIQQNFTRGHRWVL